MREINKIIVHCSVSSFGDAADIDRWHRLPPNNYNQIGYHYVILNGFRNKRLPYVAGDDGFVETGRPIDVSGAHCEGYNRDSIGVCLIGDRLFTGKQLYAALPKLLLDLTSKYGLFAKDVYGHREFNDKKTCPNIDPALIRAILTLSDGRD